ncbi:MAG: PEP-CTERM sorting domain-containing protein [Cyanobacteriota bacterium]|nr:PEP-CTERM sorting domain-containing protein [Cyanobacteriota bacterium]
MNITSAKRMFLAPLGATILLLGTSKFVNAASFLNLDNGDIGTIDTSTGVFTPFIIDAPTFLDVAIDSSNNLFGITSVGDLYDIDLSTNENTPIDNLELFINGLGFDEENILYGTGLSGFYSIDTLTGTALQVSSISGFNSSGDLVYDSDLEQFFATSSSGSTDDLWSIEKDGTATLIGDIGFNNVFGLFFENGTLFGYTENRQQISIDMTTGIGTFDKSISGTNGQIFGATSSISSTSSVPEPSITLGLLTVGLLSARFTIKQKQKSSSKKS